jgi:hypothetical protein
MRTLNFSVSPALPAWTYNGVVSMIRYNEGTGDEPINVRGASGSEFDFWMYPGDLCPLPQTEGILISSPLGQTINGVITLGAMPLTSSRQEGTMIVRQNDASFDAISGWMHHGERPLTNTVANIDHWQLYCTSGSVELRQLRITSTVAGSIVIGTSATALANLIGTGAPVKKRNGEAMHANCQARNQTSGGGLAAVLESIPVAASVERIIDLSRAPIVATSGNGIVIYHQSLAALSVTIDADFVVRP